MKYAGPFPLELEVTSWLEIGVSSPLGVEVSPRLELGVLSELDFFFFHLCYHLAR